MIKNLTSDEIQSVEGAGRLYSIAVDTAAGAFIGAAVGSFGGPVGAAVGAIDGAIHAWVISSALQD